MAYHFRNLVFEGGGVKGIAYIGALDFLGSKGILGNIKRVGGTSAGAIIALLVGLNYSLSELQTILTTLNFNNFLDKNFGIFHIQGFNLIRDVANIDRIVNRYGLYTGDFFHNWAAEKIAAKTGDPDATFEDISKKGGFRDMSFMGVNLCTGYAEVFSLENTPAVSLADAVRISMSIPLFFTAIRVPSQGDVQRLYVDGGVIDNYPIRLFDQVKYVEKHSWIPSYYQEHNAKIVPEKINTDSYVFNQESLGFRLGSETDIGVFRDQKDPPRRQIKNIVDYAEALWGALTNVQQNMHLHSDDWQRTIYIDNLGVGTTDFGISDEKKKQLEESGEKGAEDYFKWYDDPNSKPINRP